MDALRRIVGALRRASRTAVRDVEVTGAQLFVLRQLADAPGLSVSDLSERTSTRQNSVSEVVSRLVDRGLVRRKIASDDARRAVIGLTAAGRRIVKQAPPTAQAALLEALHALPRHQRGALARSLEAWVMAAGLGEEPTTMFFERPHRRERS